MQRKFYCHPSFNIKVTLRQEKYHTFFYGAQSAFSQWHPPPFCIDGIPYTGPNQGMMSNKVYVWRRLNVFKGLSKGLIPSDTIAVDFYIKKADPHKKGGATCGNIILFLATPISMYAHISKYIPHSMHTPISVYTPISMYTPISLYTHFYNTPHSMYTPISVYTPISMYTPISLYTLISITLLILCTFLFICTLLILCTLLFLCTPLFL